MFSRRIMMLVGVGFFIAVALTVIAMSSRENLPAGGVERLSITLTSPFQLVASRIIGFTESVWQTYFSCVHAMEENQTLRRQLLKARHTANRCNELELENARLKKFVNFQSSVPAAYVAAQVIARDPSPWFKTIMIDKGEKDGLIKGLPVLVSEGIVGQIIKVSGSFSRVLLVTDRNSSVDALIQETRVRGMVKGNNQDTCSFVYTLRKDEVQPGQVIVSSGLDQVFPKGLIIGAVLDVQKNHSQLFQDITIKTAVDFDRLEEVLIYKNAD
ncbi:rod shape-determining protein MreC [uncultured Desulfobacter sp.]|uniref:rod shape-determining protein MreC n=1 Tax=uncultured Desulfobacter sp. TaxID=240139 RepID=UPI0029F58415|nr:rod shape-determining protein MreC [uncultured Desulfobacter sp.]